ncbi:hypothetical protein [Pedobacter sp. UBA4863]|uniref:hypothetical protein n=1 Tax=Pedobacter sp. UBA4863 TaxID=1947060 RepID=UPI0025F503E6|nr:hypothetical protein [Pedobacter sp. UBA4863]
MTEKVFQASAESKAQAKQLRLFALLAWFVAMAGQVFAILKLIQDETLVWLVVAIVVILILTIVGSWLWKKANRLDPASEQDKVKFFIQNQLGAILGVLAFLPMVIFIFTNKNASGKTKGIAGAAAVIAMLVAGITGVDFNPPSIEKYTKEINEQTDVLKKINLNNDLVYWTREGNKYHIYEDCQHIKGRDSISSGTVKESFEKKGLSELCKTCQKRAIKQNDVSENILSEKALDTAGSE